MTPIRVYALDCRLADELFRGRGPVQIKCCRIQIGKPAPGLDDDSVRRVLDDLPEPVIALRKFFAGILEHDQRVPSTGAYPFGAVSHVTILGSGISRTPSCRRTFSCRTLDKLVS